MNNNKNNNYDNSESSSESSSESNSDSSNSDSNSEHSTDSSNDYTCEIINSEYNIKSLDDSFIISSISIDDIINNNIPKTAPASLETHHVANKKKKNLSNKIRDQFISQVNNKKKNNQKNNKETNKKKDDCIKIKDNIEIIFKNEDDDSDSETIFKYDL